MIDAEPIEKRIPFAPRFRAALRCAALAFLLVPLLASAGCSLFRRGPALAPEGFAMQHDSKALTDPATMVATYRQLFPERRYLKISDADLTVQRRWLGIGKPFAQSLTFIADDGGQIRLRINAVLGPVLVDVARSARVLSVALPEDAGKQAVFTGPTVSEASPFGKVFGVEPQDMRRLMTIGERVWKEQWAVISHWGSLELDPKGGAPLADGLERIDLDKKSGLPTASHWRRGKEAWQVRYESWGWFTGDGEPKLMPERVSVEPDHPAVKITLEMKDPGRSYPAYAPSPNANPFAMQPAPNADIVPLDRLDRALQEMIEQ